jgi:cytidylate kinase
MERTTRVQEAIELLYEDENLNSEYSEVIPKIESFFLQLDRILPNYLNSDFFIELAEEVRVNLISNPEYAKRFLEGKMGVITVTYELGSGGLDVAKKVAEKLNYRLIFMEVLPEVAKRLGVPEWKIEGFSEFKYVPSKLSLFDLFQLDKDIIDFGAIFSEKKKDISFEDFREALIKTVTAFAVSNNVVIVGHGAPCILQEYPNSLHVKIEAPFADRVKTYAKRTGKSLEEAERELKKVDEKEALFYKDICNVDLKDISNFHVKLNTSKLGIDIAAEIVLKLHELLIED